ncbi:DUF2207 family protein [Acrocarpospora catenulata]|uniref:DUF2207 family protein n=1 Tax=Acrocarpospora catenulata TaxID=2836182 RepID=UPI001BDB09B7|nr:DUF2207 domain-containing protein [Acrocarpospora catenulata]
MVPWLATAVAIGLWLLLLLALAHATRNPDVAPGPATAELADEPPAVVDLITGGWRLCDEASSATLLDLAARGVVGIEEVGPELSLVRLRRDPGNLRPYEKLVYDHVRALAVDGVVATGALAEGTRDLRRWWRSFRRKVIADARSRGLSQARWSRAQAMLLTAAAVVPAAAAGIATAVSDPESDAGMGAAIVVFFLLVALMGRLNGERGTALGAQRAGHWLGVREHFSGGRFAEQSAASVTIWGRHLAYAAVLGLAPRAVAGLPVSTPADDRRAWSDYGGMWHVVNVRYPSRLLWGRPVGATILRGLAAGAFTGFWTWIALLVASAFDVWPSGLVSPGAWTVGLAVAALPVTYALIDLATGERTEGQVVRLRQVQTGSAGEGNAKYIHWCAIDEGRDRNIKAFGIREQDWQQLTEGDQIRVRLGRRLGWIHEIVNRIPSRPRNTGYDDTGEYRAQAPMNLGEVPLFDQPNRHDRWPGNSWDNPGRGPAHPA